MWIDIDYSTLPMEMARYIPLGSHDMRLDLIHGFVGYLVKR